MTAGGDNTMHVTRDPDELDRRLGSPRLPSVFVPTMGALHAGHEALIRRGVAIAAERDLPGGCVVSIFVNPTQFNDPADYERYARTLDADLAMCRRSGVSVVFSPPLEVVYPPSAPIPTPLLPPVATAPGLEDAGRPGHFAGVCQVVKRLFDFIQPAAAVFGEKDWQQLQVIDAMVRSLELGIEIIPAPTIRAPDGLAASSRNARLSNPDRKRACAINRALNLADEAPSPDRAERVMARVLAEQKITPEYAVVRDARSLTQPIPGRPARMLIAAIVGGVRLLDNAPWHAHRDPASV
jgi:pantoate--beta-alanine ligase